MSLSAEVTDVLQGALEALSASARAKKRGPLPKGRSSMASLDQAAVAASAAAALAQGACLY